jgi:hypothetical protein
MLSGADRADDDRERHGFLTEDDAIAVREVLFGQLAG